MFELELSIRTFYKEILIDGFIQYSSKAGVMLINGVSFNISIMRIFVSIEHITIKLLAARTLKVHTGFDFMYDASFENYHPDKIPSEVDFAGKFMLGYHLGFQYLIERFAFYYSLGWYLYKESPSRGSWYMRAGGRIGLTEKLDVHLALKTRNGGIADWIEWGLVYKLKVHD